MEEECVRKLLRMKAAWMAFMVFVLAVGLAMPAAAQWKPVRPITAIVPWAPGGSTDLTVRVLASEMEKHLGQRIAVVNTPGAAGSIGSRNAFNAPRDGYTWSSNSDTSQVTYAVRGFMDQTHREWHSWLAIFTPNVITVHPDSPFQTVHDLVEAMKQRPVSVASAGVGSSGHVGAEVFRLATGVDYRHVPYEGGNPAVIAVVSGEAEVVMQLSMEVADMLRAGRLRALAAMTEEPLVISGYGEIPPITDFIPDHPSVGSRMGLFIPRGIPDEVIAAIDDAFVKAVQSDAIKKFADERGTVVIDHYGQRGDEMLEDVARRVNWILYDAGVAEKSPEEFGIPRP